MSIKDKNVVVTGGSRGLGLGLVEALVAHGARVTVVARGAAALESVRARLGVATVSADVTDETAAHRILAEIRPDILALNAGAVMENYQEPDGSIAILEVLRPYIGGRTRIEATR
jgi:NAD(P)-dependent dehydrogenase (short-subunit alcohol dehydrogenase family)